MSAAPPGLPPRGDGVVVRRTGMISVAAAAGIATGLLLDVVIAASFGAGALTDSFFVAGRLPLGVVQIVLVAANQVLVPVYSGSLATRGEQATWELASRTLTATLLLGGLVAGAVFVTAPLLVAVTAPGMAPQAADSAVGLMRVMALAVPLGCLAEVYRALLAARRSFLAPAAMHVVLNSVAAGAVLAAPNPTVRLVAWCYIAGMVCQLAMLATVAHRRGFRVTGALALGDPALRDIARLCRRPLAGAGLNPAMRVGEQVVASLLPAGSVTLLNYGNRLVSAISGTVFFRSVLLAIVPSMSATAARGDEEGLRRESAVGLRLLVGISVPLALFLGVLAAPLTHLTFRRGMFTEAEAALLGLLLTVYAVSVVGSGVQRALLAPFYASLDTRTPWRNTLYGVMANAVLLPPAVLPWRGQAGAVVGAAAAYSAAQFVNMGHAAWCLRRRLGPLRSGVGRLSARLGLAAACGGASMLAAGAVLGGPPLADRLPLAGWVAAVGAVGLVSFALVVLLTGDLQHLLRAASARRPGSHGDPRTRRRHAH